MQCLAKMSVRTKEYNKFVVVGAGTSSVFLCRLLLSAGCDVILIECGEDSDDQKRCLYRPTQWFDAMLSNSPFVTVPQVYLTGRAVLFGKGQGVMNVRVCEYLNNNLLYYTGGNNLQQESEGPRM